MDGENYSLSVTGRDVHQLLIYSHSCLCREIPECVGYVSLFVEF